MSIEDEKPPRPHRLGVRFEPVITIGNLISLMTIVGMAIAGFWTVYTSVEHDIASEARAAQHDIDDVRRSLAAFDTRVSVVDQKTDGNSAAISQDRSDFKAFTNEMRGAVHDISESIAKLREDLAKYGAIKSR